ncbi:unnamed protein product [Scytosiphon promiscuus]
MVGEQDPAVVFVSGEAVREQTGASANNVAARVAAPAAAAFWSDGRPLSEQLSSYPATCFLAAVFVMVFLLMSRMRVSSTSMGSSYRNLLVRSEWWRVVTAVVAHGGLLHLAFNITSLWSCRRLEAELGSGGYLLASAHLVVLSEIFGKMFMHVLLKTGRVTDEVSYGYSGVVFAWMVVLSLKPDAPDRVIGGVAFSGFGNVLLNLLVVRILIRRTSFVGHLAGVFAGLLLSTGALDFARERFWGLGLAVWALAVVLGSLKATTTVPLPLIDYVDLSGRDDLGVSVVPLDWNNREWLEDWVAAGA